MKRLPFSDPMFLAFLAGQKTQTRRLPTRQPYYHERVESLFGASVVFATSDGLETSRLSPYYRPGETVACSATIIKDETGGIRYRANGELASRNSWESWSWKVNTLAPRYCPLWACTHTAEIVGVDLQRLRDISRDEAFFEGISAINSYEIMPDCKDPLPAAFPDFGNPKNCFFGDPVPSFFSLWDTLHTKPGERSSDNPYVWVYKIRRIK